MVVQYITASPMTRLARIFRLVKLNKTMNGLVGFGSK